MRFFPALALARSNDLADESLASSLFGAEWAGSETDVFDPGAAADQLGKAREGADVRSQADGYLGDREGGGGCSDADVGAEGKVDAEAMRVSMEKGYDGFGAAFEGGEARLEGRNVGEELPGNAGRI